MFAKSHFWNWLVSADPKSRPFTLHCLIINIFRTINGPERERREREREGGEQKTKSEFFIKSHNGEIDNKKRTKSGLCLLTFA